MRHGKSVPYLHTYLRIQHIFTENVSIFFIIGIIFMMSNTFPDQIFPKK